MDLGSGTRWRLDKAVERDRVERERVEMKFASLGTDKDVAKIMMDNARLLLRCEAMLRQALSGSGNGDVRFQFDDGRMPLSGHRAVLCSVSEEYMWMFRSGIVEEQEGIVLVPPGISEAGFRGLLEWVYLGEALSLHPCFPPLLRSENCCQCMLGQPGDAAAPCDVTEGRA